MAAFAEGIFRSIMFFFDQIIYGFIPTIYNFIMVLAGVTVFSEESIQKIANNIYGIIGLFVVFRIAFILINAIVNPDKLTDKQAGFAKMLSKVLIALLLIVAIPFGFELGYRLQRDILKNQVMEKIILGGMSVENSNYGSNMSYLALRSFLTCKLDENDSACQDLEIGYSEAFYPQTGETSFSYLSDILNKKIEIDRVETFAYDYKAGLSTVCGVVILFMLITLCFDVAVRVIKLGFLQMIAPIAVVGYIEPTKNIFKTWLTITLTTYFNLFVRIISIAFVAYVMSAINFNLVDLDGNPLTGSTQLFAQIFLILGLLIFAKEAPKMIMNILGLKEESVGSINPLKRLGSVPFVGGAAAAGLTAGVGLGTSLGAKGLAGAGGALGGGIGSALRGAGFMSGAKAGGAAGLKKIPLSGKPNYGKMLGGVLGAGGIGGVAGYTSDASKVAAIQKTLDKNGGDVSSLFKNQEVKSAYSDFAAKKNNVNKVLKPQSSAFANNYNKFNRASQMLASTRTGRDAAMGKADELKTAMDAALASKGNLSAEYLTARDSLNNYRSSADYTSAINMYDQAQRDVSAAEAEFNSIQASYGTTYANVEAAYYDSQAKLQSATKEMSDAESTFKAQLEMPGNKADSDKYKTYKSAKDRGHIS